jgi:hypothetical protein
MLYYQVSRGRNKEALLTPWLHKHGTFHVLKVKGDPPTRVKNEEAIVSYPEKGYSLRMGNKEEGHSPSLIRPSSIRGWGNPK